MSVRLSTTVSKRLKARTQRTAKSLGTTPSKVVKYALELYLALDEQEQSDRKREARRVAQGSTKGRSR